MPETAELTELTQVHRVLAQPPGRAGASIGRRGAIQAVRRDVDDLDNVHGRVHDSGYGGHVRGSAR
jgi:hypothetical protein